MKCIICDQHEARPTHPFCEGESCTLMHEARLTPGFNDIQEAPGWGRDVLPIELVKAGMNYGAEIGVQKGEHAEKLLRAGVHTLLMVDLWSKREDYFDIANVENAEHDKNLAATRVIASKFPGRCRILLGSSNRSADVFDDGRLDFVYLDADHKYAGIRDDLKAWYPKVRSGGIIAGHDYMDSPNCCGSEFGVATAVREFIARLGLKTINVAPNECFPNWHFIKP